MWGWMYTRRRSRLRSRRAAGRCVRWVRSPTAPRPLRSCQRSSGTRRDYTSATRQAQRVTCCTGSNWQLTKLGVQCEVIAPSLVPVKSGDRVKTDRRDAEKLARALRAGDLSAVFVPDAEHEALRDLVRAREATKTDELRARHRVSKFLLRYGKYPPAGCRA